MAQERSLKDSFTRDNIKSLMANGFKTAYVRDAAGRIESLYEAPLNIGLGDPCLRTQFKYIDGAAGTSRSVIATIESVIGWPGFEVVSAGSGDDFNLVP